MRVSAVSIPGAFKRFGSLDIHSIGSDVQLVVMLGPNGSGKTSVFDAFLEWARSQGRRQRHNVEVEYFNSGKAAYGTPTVSLHDTSASQSSEPLGPLVHVRTAHRNTPDVATGSVNRQGDFRRRRTFERMAETDAALDEHYQRLVGRILPVLSRLKRDDAARDLEDARAELEPLESSLTRVFPHLRLDELWDPDSQGSFYFTRDDGRRFRYENLSGGEKAAFDLLLDVYIAAKELRTPLVCIDEPEVHLNPAVQASMLTELLRLLPSESQLWIATHSIGMIRRAFEISAERPDQVAFLDFGQVKGPEPVVELKPSRPSRQLLREAMSLALDDLGSLLAPEILVMCEGEPGQ